MPNMVFVKKSWLSRFPKARDLVDILSMGLTVVVTEEPTSDGLAYIGFYPDELQEEVNKALPLIGDEITTLYNVLVHFCLGFIPTEVAAFKGEKEDIVSRMVVAP